MDLAALATKTAEALMPSLSEQIDKKLEEKIAPLKEKAAATSSNIERWMAGQGARVTENVEKGVNLARCALAMAAVKSLAMRGVTITPAAYAEKMWGVDAAVTKALASGDFAGGGAWLKPEFAPDFIEFLRAKLAFSKLNSQYTTSNVPVTWMRQNAASTAGYLGEGGRLGLTDVKSGTVTGTPHKVGAAVMIPNELIRAQSSNVDMRVRDDLAAQVALVTDLAFIRGDGLSDTPKGLLNWAKPANKIAATQAGSVATLDEIVTLLNAMILALQNANIPMIRPGWIMAPRTVQFLRTFRNALGIFVYKDEIDAGRWNGWPYADTTQIPINLGSGTNESEIYLGDFYQFEVLAWPEAIIQASTEATIIDANGVSHSALQDDFTAVTILTANDLVLRHEEAVAVGTTVKWGA